jgi:hypothetical protein
MYKAIFDLTTGKIVAICLPQQDAQAVMSNYSNVDMTEINELPESLRNFNWHIDLETKELVK